MFVGCGDTNTSQDDQIKQVYYTYVAYAEEKGETPMSYEDWPASIKGDKGDKGDTGANVTDGEDGANGKSVYELYLQCYTLLFRRKRE